MFRDTSVKELRNLETGEPAGFALTVGGMSFHLPTREAVRRELVAIANDPKGHERAYNKRCVSNETVAENTCTAMPTHAPDGRRYEPLVTNANRARWRPDFIGG